VKSIIPVERVQEITVAQFEKHFLSRYKPVVIENIANRWKVRSFLTPENIKEKFGDLSFSVYESDDEFEHYTEKNWGNGDRRRITMSVRDYISAITRPEPFEKRPPYMANVNLDGYNLLGLQEIKKLMDYPAYFPDTYGKNVCLWIGAPGQRGVLHNDNQYNFNAQIYGKKYWLLVSPEQYHRLYTLQVRHPQWLSRVDPQKPDYEIFPLFRDVEALETTLEPGDILYIPIFWWHQALSVTVTVNSSLFVTTGMEEYWIQGNR
jgi:hypothetical protein